MIKNEKFKFKNVSHNYNIARTYKSDEKDDPHAESAIRQVFTDYILLKAAGAHSRI